MEKKRRGGRTMGARAFKEGVLIQGVILKCKVHDDKLGSKSLIIFEQTDGDWQQVDQFPFDVGVAYKISSINAGSQLRETFFDSYLYNDGPIWRIVFLIGQEDQKVEKLRDLGIVLPDPKPCN